MAIAKLSEQLFMTCIYPAVLVLQTSLLDRWACTATKRPCPLCLQSLVGRSSGVLLNSFTPTDFLSWDFNQKKCFLRTWRWETMYVYCMGVMREILLVCVKCTRILTLTQVTKSFIAAVGVMVFPLCPRLQCRTKSTRIPRARTLWRYTQPRRSSSSAPEGWWTWQVWYPLHTHPIQQVFRGLKDSYWDFILPLIFTI